MARNGRGSAEPPRGDRRAAPPTRGRSASAERPTDPVDQRDRRGGRSGRCRALMGRGETVGSTRSRRPESTGAARASRAADGGDSGAEPLEGDSAGQEGGGTITGVESVSASTSLGRGWSLSKAKTCVFGSKRGAADVDRPKTGRSSTWQPAARSSELTRSAARPRQAARQAGARNVRRAVLKASVPVDKDPKSARLKGTFNSGEPLCRCQVIRMTGLEVVHDRSQVMRF